MLSFLYTALASCCAAAAVAGAGAAAGFVAGVCAPPTPAAKAIITSAAGVVRVTCMTPPSVAWEPDPSGTLAAPSRHSGRSIDECARGAHGPLDLRSMGSRTGVG